VRPHLERSGWGRSRQEHHTGTLSTIISYLVAKRFVAKEATSRRDGNFYTPIIITKEQLMLQAMQSMLDDLHATPGKRQRLLEALRKV